MFGSNLIKNLSYSYTFSMTKMSKVLLMLIIVLIVMLPKQMKQFNIITRRLKLSQQIKITIICHYLTLTLSTVTLCHPQCIHHHPQLQYIPHSQPFPCQDHQVWRECPGKIRFLTCIQSVKKEDEIKMIFLLFHIRFWYCFRCDSINGPFSCKSNSTFTNVCSFIRLSVSQSFSQSQKPLQQLNINHSTLPPSSFIILHHPSSSFIILQHPSFRDF